MYVGSQRARFLGDDINLTLKTNIFNEMSTNAFSYLYKSVIEDFTHAIEHFKRGKPIDNKYAVINAASSVELILKEKLRLLGVPVFQRKPPYHSLGFYECITKLNEKQVKIPRETDIEFLHKERNICVHLAGKPDGAKTKWLMDVTKNFLQQFCLNVLNIAQDELPDILRIEKIIRVKLEAPTPIYEVWLNAARRAYPSKNYAVCLVNSNTAIELVIMNYLERTKPADVPYIALHKMLREKRRLDMLSNEIFSEIKMLSNRRNEVVHAGRIVTKNEALSALELAKSVIEIVRSYLEALA